MISLSINDMCQRRRRKRSTSPPSKSTSTTSTASFSSIISEEPQDTQEYRRTVSFDKLEIYGFPKVLGDNPCAHGAAVQLDQRPDYRVVLSIDEFERYRLPRRDCETLRLSSAERENYLLGTGYGYNEVVNAATKNAELRQERWDTFHMRHWEPFYLFLEYLYEDMRHAYTWANEMGVWSRPREHNIFNVCHNPYPIP
ncbi:expressed unknown protein [Seminavis robusta]|uniref:Uncharacterized protein n=1 Tax=Seminavis robusta TaxID=568900 RepID=A0A9N8DRW5_9STRA|nr:expressed unknown protein [Seminavis robusta]|eukprot:Sro238_g095520.1 n/a (198) ;mRNA; f:30198-30791